MKQTIDLIKIPYGYAKDIRDFCQPILEVAMSRGETSGEFDDDFFYELLETHLSNKAEEVILYNARWHFSNDLDMLDREIEPFYEKVFEEGCRYFIGDFLKLNQLHAVRGQKSDVWKIEIKMIGEQVGRLTATSGNNKYSQ